MNKEMKDIITNSTLVFLIIAAVYLGGIGTAKITNNMRSINPISVEQDTTDIFDKKQVVETKEDIDYTGTTQGEDSLTKEEMLSKEPDFIYYDTIKMKKEADSIDAYMRYWYYEANDFFGTSESGDSFDSYHITGDLLSNTNRIVFGITLEKFMSFPPYMLEHLVTTTGNP